MSVPRYWRNIPQRVRMEALKCKSCGKIIYPPRAKCIYCGKNDFECYTIPEKGRLISFSIIRHPPIGFEHTTPYVVGIIEFENGLRISSQITDVDTNELKIGMEVEQVFRKVSEDGKSGIIQYAIKFRPIFQNI
ncbi:MAG: Zn-ribbon domain-containing OB-fold protein [Candidatus Methanomethylicia archaeon]|jgi:uncharacterized OB-fold protein|nr:Zn-ribbon domain-containing OB-fold protein [Candidatus Methanomethylicia archaeon]